MRSEGVILLLLLLLLGFASDGKGGIDAKEFCDMIIHLMYKIRNDSSQRAEEEEKRALHDSREHRINSLFIELCRSVLKNDKYVSHKLYTN